MIQKTKNEILSDLIQAFEDELGTLNDKELTEKYQEMMGDEVEIVE
ncbi:MAG: hypothetical protein WC346_03640 [Methanogenium sp.]|jgi:hypothetical protein